MPCEDLPLEFQDKLKIVKKWNWSGQHYEKTANAWLKNIDTNKDKAMLTLKKIYGKNDAFKWFQRWRIFFMSCEVLFGFDHGSEWGVSHYLFEKPQ